MTTIGNCQLCGIKSELQDSHIWPRFIYKATIADQTKGGAFVDIAKGDRSNRQYTLPLFCRACETGRTGPADSEAARIIKLFLERKCEKVTYTVEFLRFAVSISLRTVLFHQITRSASFDKSQRQRIYPAIKRWKEFLLEKTDDLGPYTQHTFCVITESEISWHRAAGGQVGLAEDLVNSQIGPLYIFGVLNRTGTEGRDRKILKASEVGMQGELTRLKEMVGGTHLTPQMLARLKSDAFLLEQRIRAMEI